MAVLLGARVDTPLATTITWGPITTADTGAPVNLSEFAEIKSVHVFASGGGGTAQMRRSNDGINFVNFGAAFAGDSVNDFTTACKFMDIGAVATATVTVILTASKKALKV